MNTPPAPPPFHRLGPETPHSPVVLAVPHAGRVYPPALIAAATVPPARLAVLEDRYADLLIDRAVAEGAVAFIASHARAWIDLNRDERELDPAMVEPSSGAQPRSLIGSAKVRGGLGLIPRRIGGVGEIVRRRLTHEEVAARIAADHRPWHAAIAGALAAARARFGVAVLIDCHSMPPIAAEPRGQQPPPRIVIGDRYGRSAAARYADRAIAVADAAGLSWRLNSPYAGGHTLDRHGDFARGVHAIQVEIDRSLYLGPDLRTPGAGVARMAGFVAALATALADEATSAPGLAAE